MLMLMLLLLCRPEELAKLPKCCIQWGLPTNSTQHGSGTAAGMGMGMSTNGAAGGGGTVAGGDAGWLGGSYGDVGGMGRRSLLTMNRKVRVGCKLVIQEQGWTTWCFVPVSGHYVFPGFHIRLRYISPY